MTAPTRAPAQRRRLLSTRPRLAEEGAAEAEEGAAATEEAVDAVEEAAVAAAVDAAAPAMLLRNSRWQCSLGRRRLPHLRASRSPEWTHCAHTTTNWSPAQPRLQRR